MRATADGVNHWIGQLRAGDQLAAFEPRQDKLTM
jgi:hypothetical protein